MATAQDANTKNIDQLNSFLRGEMSAVETYRIALEKLDASSTYRNQLETCRASHLARVTKLQEKIRQLGGKPSDTAGAWGAMVGAIETSAAMLGDKVAVAALEEGEDHGLRDYRIDLDSLSGETRQLVMTELIPKQAETHRMLSDLKLRLAQA